MPRPSSAAIRCAILSSSIAGWLAAETAFALTGTWTTDAGGSWNTGPWLGGTPGAIDDTADFGTLEITAARTITLDGSRTVGSLIFNDATVAASQSWTIAAGTPASSTLTLATSVGTPTINVGNAGAAANITAIIAGTQGFTKTGAGNLTLGSSTGSAGSAVNTAANTYTGNTIIAGGILGISGDAALGAVPGVFTPDNIQISNGAFLANMTNATGSGTSFGNGFDITLSANRGVTIGAGGGGFRVGYTKTLTINGAISGVASITKNDGGTVVLAGDGSGFTGVFNNDGGATRVSALNANWANTDFNVNSTGGALTFNGGGTATVNSVASTRDVFIQNGMTLNVDSGVVSLATNGHWWQTNTGVVGNLTSSSGTLTITNGAATGDLTTLDHRIRVNIVDFNGSTPLALVKNNNNSLVLDKANSYSGGSAVNGGRINADHFSALGTGTVTVNNGGQVWLTQSNIFGGAYANNFVINGNGPTEGTAGQLGAIRLVDTTILGSVTVAGASRIVPRGSSGATTANLAGPLLGTGSLEINSSDVANSGTINLLGSGAGYTGTTTVSKGRFNFASSFGGSIVVADGATLGGGTTLGGNLTLGATAGATYTNAKGTLAVTGALTLNGVNTIELIAPAPGTANVTLFTYGGALTGSAANLLLPNLTTYRGTPTFDLSTPGQVNLTGFDVKNLTWAGASAAWDVKTSNNWNAGAEQFSSADRVTFDDSGSDAAPIAITGLLLPGALTINSSTKNYVFTGSAGNLIGGFGSLLKDGSSTLAINAPNTFSGGSVLSEGTILLRNSGALGTGLITVGDNNSGAADLALYLDANRTSIANKLVVTNNTTGVVTLGSKSTVTGSGDNNEFKNIALQRDVVFDSNASDRTDYENISGTGNITVIGTNRSTFPTDNPAWVGDITVATTGASGALQIGVGSGAGNRIPDTAKVTVNAGAALRLSTAGETIASLNGEGAVDANQPSGGTATLTVGFGNANGNFSGVLKNPTQVVALTKIGTGTQILSGDNTYTGATTVSGGTLQIGTGGATGQIGAGAVSLGTGATLTFNRTGSASIGGALNSVAGDAGTLNVDGGVALTLSVGGNFSGAINLLNGSSLILGATNPINNANNPTDFTLGSGTLLTNTDASTHAHIGNVTLNGAIWTTGSGTGSYDGENYQLNGNVVVTGSASSTITRDAARTDGNSGVSLNGQRTFTVSDVTGTAAADLIVSTQLEARDGGVIGGLTKEGGGTMVLEAGPAHSYTGATTINAGTLLVNAVLGGSTTTVNSGVLGGTGTLAATTVESGGTLAPGLSIGTLNFSSTLTLAGTVNIELNKAGAVLTSDLLNVTGLLTLGGTLNVGANGDVLAEGDSFNLFDAGSVAGTFATLNLPALGSGLSWDTSGLPGSGNIVVVPEPNTAIAMIGGIGLLLGLRRRRSAE